MTEKEKMIAAIYKALGDGLAKMFRHGLAITVMTLVISGLCYALLMQHNLFKAQIADIKKDIVSMKSEWSEERNSLRRDLILCDTERQKMAIELAELRYIVKNSKR